MKTTENNTGIQVAIPGQDSLDIPAIIQALQGMRDGDFSVRLPGNWTGPGGKVADLFNEIASSNKRMAEELERLANAVGKEGKTPERARFDRHSGAWGEVEVSVNTLIDDLLWPTREMTRAIAAVAQGDLLQRVQLDVEGRPLQGAFLRSSHTNCCTNQSAGQRRRPRSGKPKPRRSPSSYRQLSG